MDFGAFVGGLVTGLREGVEAALIASIILAYLARTGNGHYASRIWAGIGAAVGTSALLGLIVFQTVGELPAPWEQVFEGATLLVAAGVVTWMLFWMRRQAGAVKGDLHAALDRALTSGGAWGLVVLAFTAVIREGLETSIFLVGQVTAASHGSAVGGPSVVAGALTGLVLAAFLGYGFYRGTRRINLGVFFRWTGVGLVFIAGGLLGRAVHEFAEIHAIPLGTQTAFDISAVLPHQSGVGEFLAAILGYTSTPEVARLLVYLAYVAIVLALYLRPASPRPAPVRIPG